MKKSLLKKLFFITALLCLGLIVMIGAVQFFFFEQYYIKNKVKTLEGQMESYAAQPFNPESAYRFYQDNHAWITVLDREGFINYADDYYAVVTPGNGQEPLQIPLCYMEGRYSADEAYLLKVGEAVIVDMAQMGADMIPYQLQSKTGSLALINMSIAGKLNGMDADPDYGEVPTKAVTGTVTEIKFSNVSGELPFPYGELFFMEQVKEFQAGLLLSWQTPPGEPFHFTVRENTVDYQVMVMPLSTDGELQYLFAMTSLQPVSEASAALLQFYPWFTLAAVVLVLLASFAYSKWLVKPLLSLNRVTQKIANLEFSEKLPVGSGDELGQLSENINHLSEELETYIVRLREDLNQEKRLEETRKRFISGVSHELKTPLAVIKSCISILRDGIAAEKSDHYFCAVEDEVQRMDALIMEMLDLAKMSSGTYKPSMDYFELGDCVGQLCLSYGDQADAKGILLTQNIHPMLVVGHEKLIVRVLSNFLSNAVRHTKAGDEISVSFTDKGQVVEVSVENGGALLNEEELSRVWEQFYSSGNRADGGTGLGLAISKEILELHGVRYGVENTDRGIRFFFQLVKA